MCHFDKEIEMMRKEKESRKRIYELYDTPIRQADVIPKMGIYVSIFPKDVLKNLQMKMILLHMA